MKCDNCKHWRDGSYERGDGWCYMFRTAPASLPDVCTQFALSDVNPEHRRQHEDRNVKSYHSPA